MSLEILFYGIYLVFCFTVIGFVLAGAAFTVYDYLNWIVNTIKNRGVFLGVMQVFLTSLGILIASLIVPMVAIFILGSYVLVRAFILAAICVTGKPKEVNNA